MTNTKLEITQIKEVCVWLEKSSIYLKPKTVAEKKSASKQHYEK